MLTAQPLAVRSVVIPRIVSLRMFSKDVQLGRVRSVHLPDEVQVTPAAVSWNVACTWVRNGPAARAGALHTSVAPAIVPRSSVVRRSHADIEDPRSSHNLAFECYAQDLIVLRITHTFGLAASARPRRQRQS